MTTLLNSAVTDQVRQMFAESLKQPVALLFFGQEQAACDYCEDTLQLAQEVAALSDQIHLSAYDLDTHADLARQYHVDKAPTLVIAGRDGDVVHDYGIRLAGIPAGHEFSSLIHGIILVSGRESGLSTSTRQFLDELKQPVHLQVFVTPT